MMYLKKPLSKLSAICLMAAIAGCSTPGKVSQTDTPQSSQPKVSSPVEASPSAVASPEARVKAIRKANPQAVALNNQAVNQLAKGDYSKALATFNQAIQTDTNLAEAYLGRGIAHSGLRQRQAAFQNYNQAIKLNANFAEAYLNRADEYAAMGKRKEAIADFDRAAQLFQQQGNQPNVRFAQARMEDLKPPPAPITPASSPPPGAVSVASNPKMALAMHLRQAGAKMYATYWCSVCNWQREQFGEAAFRQITYVECDPKGANPQVNRCNQANIAAYPTWEINGRLVSPGGYPLQELANISGYQGPRNFGG